jgi:hypothetical protein
MLAKRGIAKRAAPAVVQWLYQQIAMLFTPMRFHSGCKDRCPKDLALPW